MVRNEREFHERDPHPDGRYESVINDSMASAGEEMGVRIDINTENFVQPKNPFHLNPKKDPQLEEFSKLMEGKSK